MLPLSFCDKRYGFLQIMDCPLIRNTNCVEVLEWLRVHYNENYEPEISKKQIFDIHNLYKKHVGRSIDDDTKLLQEKNLKKKYLEI